MVFCIADIPYRLNEQVTYIMPRVLLLSVRYKL